MFLEKYALDRREELYGDLSFHFQQGGDPWKALDYTIRAGKRTEERLAMREAIGYYGRGIEIVRTLPDKERREPLRRDLMERQCRIYESIGEYGRAAEILTEVEGLLKESESPPVERARIRAKIGSILARDGHHEAAILKIEEGLADSALNAGEARARLLSVLARIHTRLGDVERSGRLCEEGLRALPTERESSVCAEIHMTMGRNCRERGEEKRAEFHMMRGIEISRSIGDLRSEGRFYLILGTLYAGRDRNGKAKSFIRKSLEIAGKANDPTLQIDGHVWAGEMAQAMGDRRGELGVGPPARGENRSSRPDRPTETSPRSGPPGSWERTVDLSLPLIGRSSDPRGIRLSSAPEGVETTEANPENRTKIEFSSENPTRHGALPIGI
jgi:tetratricopeptide (TPR) repeat protein